MIDSLNLDVSGQGLPSATPPFLDWLLIPKMISGPGSSRHVGFDLPTGGCGEKYFIINVIIELLPSLCSYSQARYDHNTPLVS